MIKFSSKFHIQILWFSFTRDNRFLLTPSQPLPGEQENTSSSVSRHFSNSLSVYFSLDSELTNGRMKVQVKRVFKGYFFVTKKTKKAERLFMKFSSTSNTSVQRSLYLPFQNQWVHFLLLHLFQRMSQSSGQYLQDVKQTNS